MDGDHGYRRYFAFMALFTTSMLGLILADNLLMLFVFWELVGLTSYLLIGFWFHRPAAAAAAKKAFLVTRLGDLGLLAAMILIWDRTGTLNIAEINEIAFLGIMVGQTVDHAVRIGLDCGRDWEERAVPAAYLAARRDGGSDAGVGAGAFGDDGGGGGLSAGANSSR